MLPSPVNACTFYQSIWRGQFMGCAEPTVKHNACTKIKQVGPLTVKYQGDLVAMYLPDFVIETATSFGESLFASVSTPLKKHLKLAERWQSKQTGALLGSGGFFDNGGVQEKEQSFFWHARLLPVPYGGLNSYPNVKAGSGGNGLPVCFTGISEFYTDEWMTGLSDLPFALSWAPVGMAMCFTNAGIGSAQALGAARDEARKQGQNALSSLTDVDISGYTSGATCAYPVSGKTGLTLNLKPDSDALDSAKLCMGSLGNLLPREGTITSHDRFRSSLAAAWKFASLVADFHPGSDAGMEWDDKWQIMFPQSSRPACFRAGQLSDIPTGPFENRKLQATGDKDETYIYAIWRRREACLEPLTGDGWRASVVAEHQALQVSCGGL